MTSKEKEFLMIKTKLALHLEKVGSSLEEFENELESGVIKSADVFEDLGKHLMNLPFSLTKTVGSALMQHAPEAVMGTAILGGATLGGGAYALGKSLDNEDKELEGKQQLVNRYKTLTDKVKADYGIH
jgi:hypothetical protein